MPARKVIKNVCNVINNAIHAEIKKTITGCFVSAFLPFIWSFLYELPKLRRTERKKLSSSEVRLAKLFLQI